MDNLIDMINLLKEYEYNSNYYNYKIEEIKLGNELYTKMLETYIKDFKFVANKEEIEIPNEFMGIPIIETNEDYEFKILVSIPPYFIKKDENIEIINELLKYNQEKAYKQKEVLDKIKEIFKDYGVKEDIVTYSNYNITGEEVYTILELLEEIE